MFDEMIDPDSDGARQPYASMFEWLNEQNFSKLCNQSKQAEELFRRIGITFNVYGQKDEQERLIPFDIIPRILSAQEWRVMEAGIVQRVAAINAFLDDVYNAQEIIKAGIIPSDLINRNKAFLPQMCGFKPPGGIYTHVMGVDIVRTDVKEFFVLEDNARVPSGVSYMIENRATMLQMFPELFTSFERRCAERSTKDSWPDAWEAIFGTVLRPGESHEKDRRAFHEAHAGDWIVVSAIASGHRKGFVECVATPGGQRRAGTEERRFLVPADEYAVGRFGFVIDPSRHAVYAGPSSFIGWQRGTSS